MSTELTWRTKSTSLEATLALAEQVGHKLKGGEVIELVSDLGGGKTTFVKGLAKGMGSKDAVRSPSFTLANQYKAEDLVIYHLDLYRLDEPGLLEAELEEILSDPKAVVVAEWSKLINTALPEDRLVVEFKPTTETSRLISFHFPSQLKYLVPKT